ncbi:SUMO-conjugating enzyme SCE1 [Spatholobus suberectus]|nr:SUMO-conjugating enzyme SCE1 [Spatholobus suberectus]
MSGIARGRLAEERKSWRKNHPHAILVPQPLLPPSPSAIPALSLSAKLSVLQLNLVMGRQRLAAGVFRGWRPAITVKQILVGIQDLLDQPNPADPAQTEGYHLFIQDAAEYKRRIRQQAKQYPPLV